jgi:cardiolipin synthase
VQFIDSAQQSLDVAMYLLSDRDILAALERGHQRGVRIRVMLEEHPYGTGPGNHDAVRRLSAAGIATRWSPPAIRLSHDKYAIADRRRALVGTANWTHSAFTRNREYLLLLTDPAEVAALAALFDADWERRPAQVADPNLVVSPLNSRLVFLGLVASARQSLELEMEEMEDPQIEQALISAAQRGVRVRVILPAAAGGEDPNRPGEEVLGAGGIEVRRLGATYVHAKDIVVDDRVAFVGSENISSPSLDTNREVGIIVADPAVVQRLEDTFTRDWQASQP